MGFVNFIKGFLNPNETPVTINLNSYQADISHKALTVAAFATFTTIEYIANIASKIEYKTYRNGKEFKGAEWYNLNIKPNKNQSSTEFWQEAISNLLYSGELLIIPIGEQKIIADNFTKTDYAITESVFTDVRRGNFTFYSTFKSSDVIYIKYANKDTETLLKTLYGMYAVLIGEAVDKYLKSGGQKVALEISAQAAGDADFENTYNDLMDNKFKSFFNAKNSVMPLFQGMKATPLTAAGTTKASNEIADIKNLIDDALGRAGQAYKFPPQLIKGEVSGINDAIDLMLTTCMDPLINCISEELTGKEFTQKEVIDGTYIDGDTTHIKHIDIFSLAPNIDKLIASGFSSVNEIRIDAGKTPIPEAWADKHFLTKNYQEIEELLKLAAGGGEK